MKQRRHGKKVYNWHRPLGKNQLKRRFLRARHQASSATAELDSQNEADELAEAGIWPFEIANYCCESCYQSQLDYAEEEDFTEQKIKTLLDTLLHTPAWLEQLDEAKQHLPSAPNERSPVPQGHSSAAPVEERLAQHIEWIENYHESPQPLQHSLYQKCDDSRRIKVVSQAGNASGNRYFARFILLFSPFWIRDPLDWPISAKPFDLLRFLFVKHEAPGFLFPAWLSAQSFSEAHLKWVLWLIIIGQGGSLKRAERHFPWRLSGKYQRHLASVPDSLPPRDAALLAEIKRLGGTDTTYRRLAEFGYFLLDPTNPDERRPFWEETVRWLHKHESELSDDDSHDILQWAIHERIESERAHQTPFTWKNRSPIACRRRADDYFTSLNTGGPNRQWTPKGWNLEFTDEDDVAWSVVELHSSAELAKEGQRMRHCVATYSIRCLAGDCAIFSLRKNGRPQITIEVDLPKPRIAQARGKFNRSATPTENAAIAQWFETRVARPD